MTNKKPLDAHDREVRRLALEEAASVCRTGVASGGPGHSWRLDCAEEIEALIDEGAVSEAQETVPLYCTGCGATRAEKMTGALAASHGFNEALICDPPPPCACGRGRWRYAR